MPVLVAVTFLGARPGQFQNYARKQLNRAQCCKRPFDSAMRLKHRFYKGVLPVCSVLHCSYLLEEDLEPFEVLPKGKIGPSLVMALRVLFASEEDFSHWHNLEGQLSTSLRHQLFWLVCLSVCLSVCLCVCLSACLPACLPACLSVCLSVCLFVCLSPHSYNSSG